MPFIHDNKSQIWRYEDRDNFKDSIRQVLIFANYTNIGVYLTGDISNDVRAKVRKLFEMLRQSPNRPFQVEVECADKSLVIVGIASTRAWGYDMYAIKRIPAASISRVKSVLWPEINIPVDGAGGRIIYSKGKADW